jgi:hypothetical protein
MIRLVSCAVLMALTLTLLGCGKGQTKSTAPPPPAIAVKAGDLLKEYDANAVAADLKYKGKPVKVTGKFGKADKQGPLGFAVNVLPEDDPGDTGIAGVQCFIMESAQADVATFKKGDVITLQGDCDGQVALGQVVLRHCTVVK